MAGGGFFLRRGFRNVDQILNLTYAAAHFWRINPFDLMRYSVDDIIELTEQAHRLAPKQD